MDLGNSLDLDDFTQTISQPKAGCPDFSTPPRPALHWGFVAWRLCFFGGEGCQADREVCWPIRASCWPRPEEMMPLSPAPAGCMAMGVAATWSDAGRLGRNAVRKV